MTDRSLLVERQLRTFVTADAILAACGGLFAIVMSLTVAEIDSLFWLGVFVLGGSGLIAAALLPLSKRNIDRTLLVLALANWVISLGVATVATFAWPLVLQSSLLPVAVAVGVATPGRLRELVVISVMVAIAVTCLGLLQDVTGLTDQAPEWLKTTVLLVFAPPFGAIIVLLSVQHSLRLSRALAAQTAARLQLVHQTSELRRSRQRVVAATDRERRRIERDLHDGAQSRLVAVNLQLAAARSLGDQDPPAAVAALDGIRAEVHRAHVELRELAHGLYPTVLTQHGLPPAIEAAADRSPLPVQLAFGPIGRLPADTEATIYFCVLEALQNAIKHANASQIEIRLERTAESVIFEVDDDGVGGSGSMVDGHGMANMRDRLGAIGGRFEVEHGSSTGTCVRGVVPLDNVDAER